MATPEESASATPMFLQENEEFLSPECRSLLQTLPSDQFGNTPHHLFQYNGFWYLIRLLNSLLSIQQNFQPDPSDILLATHPKTGTTWLKALAFALMNRSQYSPSSTDHPLLRDNPHDLVPFLEIDLYIKDKEPDLSRFAAPRLFSTHAPFSSLPGLVKSSKCKIVYMCRNPKDTAVSLWHFANKGKPKDNQIPLEEIVNKFCQGMIAYGPFWDHVLEYWKASQEMPHNGVLFLKYEEMKEQPGEQLRRLADFLGCPFSEEEETNGQVEEILSLCSFERLSKLEVNQKGKVSLGIEKHCFFRRGQAGDWANYLSEEMIEKFDRITEEKFHGSNLKM